MARVLRVLLVLLSGGFDWLVPLAVLRRDDEEYVHLPRVPPCRSVPYSDKVRKLSLFVLFVWWE